MAWTSPKTWVVGETANAADMNKYLNANFAAIGLVYISTQTVNNVANVDFSSIPQIFDTLTLIGFARGSSPSSGAGMYVACRVNADSGSNYNYTMNLTTGGTNSPTNFTGDNKWQIGRAVGAAGDQQYCTFEMSLPGYTAVERHSYHAMSAGYDGAGSFVQMMGGRWFGTAAAITELTISMSSGNIDGTFSLYGMQ